MEEYTGRNGERNFEKDFIMALQKAGWGEVLYGKTVNDLIDNWRDIILKRNRSVLNGVPLSANETDQLIETIKQEANTPVKANGFILTSGYGHGVALLRDKDSEDRAHAGKEVYLDLFDAEEIAGGSSVYQIAEQTYLSSDLGYADNQGDLTLLINGLPLIHIELKANRVSAMEAYDQERKYTGEGDFRGFMGLVQVFWAISPEDAFYFANPGTADAFNKSFLFRWGDRDNNPLKNWRDLILSSNHILSIPEAHKLIGYYVVADKAKDTLKVCRSYQYAAIKAIVKRTSEQKWGDHDQKGGFVWCTTGGGKTMTSFKAGQMITDLNLADKVVFVVDRKTLDEQSAADYNSFMRPGEDIDTTENTHKLFNYLKSDRGEDSLIITSIQKLKNLNLDNDSYDKKTIEYFSSKRIVFIIDEAHRSQFGEMHRKVEDTFYNALFFGFTGTPIFGSNLKEGEQTTESVFGRCLAVYSLASGIKDENVLGFSPSYVTTLDYADIKEKLALKKAEAVSASQMTAEQRKIYNDFKKNTPTATEYDKDGNIKRKGLEEYINDVDYDNDNHREQVVKDITKNFFTYSTGKHGPHTFHGILATRSIPEACRYWEMFRRVNPELNVTALFDMNTDANNESTISKNQYIPQILAEYNKQFGTSFDIKSDANLEKYKNDITLRLAHKTPYQQIAGDSTQVLDLVIVVDQLLTGFDSQFVNIIYLDKTLKNDSLIQAISRTNRVLDKEDKPFGIVKFYRKPNTMEKNLDDALALYCQGDYSDVVVPEIKDNIKDINKLYADIERIFAHDNIKNFDHLPSSDEDRQKFRKEFSEIRSKIKASFLQGFSWEGEETGKKLAFDLQTYKRLTQRYKDSSPGRGSSPRVRHPGNIYDTNLSSVEGDRIDSDYLESRFRILTISDLDKKEEDDVLSDIEAHIGDLPIELQPHARKIIEDIRDGMLSPEEGKKFYAYILEYRSKDVRIKTDAEAQKYGIDPDMLYDLYEKTTSGEVLQLALNKLEETADSEKIKKLYNVPVFVAKTKMHNDLKTFIEERRAD